MIYRFKLYLIFVLICLVGFFLAQNLIIKSKKIQDSEIQRIVSLAPSVTESLFALGYGDKVVGVSRFCAYPPEVNKLAKVGALDDPNFEAIFRLKADLIIANSARQQDYLEDLGFQFLLLEQDKLYSLLPSFKILDDLLDGQSQTYIQNWQSSFEQLKPQESREIKILISIMRDPYQPVQSLYTVGNDGYFSEIIKLLGANNVYQGKIKFPIISQEALLQLKPDFIIDLLPPQTDISLALKDWQNLNIPAVKNNNILIIADESALVPGPRTLNFIQQINDFLNERL